MNKIQELETSNIQLEEKILACLIHGNEQVSEILEDSFVIKKNQNIRRGIENLIKNNIAINPSNLASLLTQKTKNDGWPKEIQRICDGVDVGTIEVYKNLQQKNLLSIRALNLSQSIVSSIQDNDDDSLMTSINALSNIQVVDKKSSFSAHEAMMSSIGMMEDSMKNGNQNYYKIGIPELDDSMGGYFPNDLVILAGRPSMGKTTVATFMSYKADCPTGFISSEMQKESLINKLMSTDSGVNVEIMRKTAELTATQFSSIKDSAERMKDKQLYINEKGNITISEIEKQVQDWVETYNIKVVFVDYIQRIRHEDRQLNSVERIADIANRLKNLAKRFGITVVALAQINRESEKSSDKTPKMSDLKGSGDIEQEADIIILLHRDSYQADESNSKSKIEMIFCKNRQGRIGTVDMYFIPENCSYETIPLEERTIPF